jgi:predicted HTH transcriptional regulator
VPIYLISSPRPALRTVVAFANSAGGRLVIGVEDRSRGAREWGLFELDALDNRYA